MPAPPLEPEFTETRDRTVTLPTSPRSPWLSRQLVGQWCSEWGVSGPTADEAMVVVSELVTASFSAGLVAVSIRASLGEDRLEVAVSGSPQVAQAWHGELTEDDGDERRMDVVRGLGTSVEVRLGEFGPTTVVAIPLCRAP